MKNQKQTPSHSPARAKSKSSNAKLQNMCILISIRQIIAVSEQKRQPNLVTGYKLKCAAKKKQFNVKQQSNVFDLIHTSYFSLLLYSSYFNVFYSIKIRQRSVQITNYFTVSRQCVL